MQWNFELLVKPTDVPLTEGPVWDGEYLFFTHIHASRIMRYEPKSGAITVWREDTNRSNGLAHDDKGRLYGCCSGGRSVVRFDADGKNTVLADKFEGRRLNTPNDLTIDRRGRIWFTNPVNGGNWDKGSTSDLDNQSVFRLDPQPGGSYSITRVTFDTTQPNGILVSQDNNTLYVAESSFNAQTPRELRAYPIREDGSLGSFTTLHTWGADARGVHRGIDGMCLDRDGNIVATNGWDTAGPGPMITVFAPSGRVLETHPVPAKMPTNCCFGGADMTTLFVTAWHGHVFKVKTNRVGWAMYP